VASACEGLLPLPVLFGDFVGMSYYERLLLPPAVYRKLRCNDADQQWFQKVSAYVVAPVNPPTAGYSNVVFTNISLSEFWPNNPTAAVLTAKENTMVAYAGFPPALAAAKAASWPIYPHDAYFGKWPSSPVPILVLQGTLDARTPYGSVEKAHYSGPNRYYVEFPNGAHIVGGFDPSAGYVTNQAPMADSSVLYSCGWLVIESFLADPSKKPDTSCIAGMAPLGFGNPPTAWLARVGVQDLWENP
jgi:hypothetical protein